MTKPLIVALDVDTDKDVMRIVRQTKKFVDIYKVGPPLLLRYGPGILKKIRSQGKKIFLDFKFHDIPNTMVRSLKEASKDGIFSATVHVSAGESALRAVSNLAKRPKIWGVTVLTSLTSDDLSKLGYQHAPLEQTIRFGEMAQRCGCDGIVASVGETALLRSHLGSKMTIITPGIRLPENDRSDQQRVATPQHARMAGSDFIVVGRPIVENPDPSAAAEAIMKDWKRGEKLN